jgi:hypothetical protein
MSLVERAYEIRKRLRNPPNAVADHGIDLKRRVEIIDHTPSAMPVPVSKSSTIPIPVPQDPTDGTWTKRRKPDESDAAFTERQIKYYRGRLAMAEARREKMFGKRKTVRIEVIMDAVCAVFGVNKNDMLSNRRTAELVMPRHVAMFLSKELTARSLPDIGRMFSDRDHTTVLHAVRRIHGLRASDPLLDAMIARVEAVLASPTETEDATCLSSVPTTAQ